MTHRAARVSTIAAALAAALTCSGCVEKDTSVTMRLEPDGSLTWTVIERNIHATGDTPAERQREEDEFMALAASDRHPNVVAFRSLGGLDVRTQIISSRWPYAVLTEARFADVAQVFQRITDNLSMGEPSDLGVLHSRSTIERRGDRTTWTLAFEYDANGVPSTAGESNTIPPSLLGDDVPTFVMQHGEFISATGFDISHDGRVAKANDLDDHDWDKEPKVTLSLTWVGVESTKQK